MQLRKKSISSDKTVSTHPAVAAAHTSAQIKAQSQVNQLATAAIAEFAAPISPALPCGPSVEYEHEYAILAARLQPRADVQYGSFSSQPEAPDWAEIERDARRLLLKSKDINLFVWLLRGRTRSAGAVGLMQGLSALQAVLEQWGEHVHPLLEQDGLFEPQLRANALGALCDPQGLLGDVRELLLCANTASRLSVRDVEGALGIPRAPYAPEPGVVQRQIADLIAKGEVAVVALLQSLTCLNAIAAWCKTSLGDEGPDLSRLQKLLGLIAPAPLVAALVGNDPIVFVQPETHLEPVLQTYPALASLPDPGHHALLELSTQPMSGLNHAQQREQIRGQLLQLRQWIELHEPSSPVATLLKQAHRMWGKRFSEVAHQIPPDLLQAWDQND